MSLCPCTKISILKILSDEVSECKVLLDKRWTGIKAIPHTQTVHHVKVVKLNELLYAELTNESSMRKKHLFR